MYTKKKQEKKKRKVVKKIGRKHSKKKTNAKTSLDMVGKVDNEENGIQNQKKSLDMVGKMDSEEHDIQKKKKSTIEWIKPMRNPTKIEERSMFGKALEIMIVLCMDNHVYQFGNIVRVQKEGGPIGLKLTGEIADCLMIDWDKKMLKELSKYNLIPEVYTRFKDDIEIVLKSLEKGSELIYDKIVVNENKKVLDENKTDCKITMEIVQKIANNIDPMIQLTVETPCNSEDGKLAVLDVKANINENEHNRIDFEFFEKPTKYPKVILANSALSFNKKRTILTQEGLRRLRNTKIELGPEIQQKHLNKFMLKLKNSGYGQKFRKELLDSILKAFQKMQDEDKSGVKPMFRSRDWNREKRDLMKSKKKVNWWNTEKSTVNYKSILFVTPTPGGVLAKEVERRETELNKNAKERIKIVEKGGLKLKDMLGTKNNVKNSKCNEKSCPLCNKSQFVEPSTDENQISCITNNVGYRWVCLTCEERGKVAVYEGETSRSARIRGAEHLKGLVGKNIDNILYKHRITEHKHEDVKFQMKITKKFKDALTRQANEGVRIYGRPKSESLNRKSEFNHPPIARVVVE